MPASGQCARACVASLSLPRHYLRPHLNLPLPSLGSEAGPGRPRNPHHDYLAASTRWRTSSEAASTARTRSRRSSGRERGSSGLGTHSRAARGRAAARWRMVLVPRTRTRTRTRRSSSSCTPTCRGAAPARSVRGAAASSRRYTRTWWWARAPPASRPRYTASTWRATPRGWASSLGGSQDFALCLFWAPTSVSTYPDTVKFRKVPLTAPMPQYRGC